MQIDQFSNKGGRVPNNRDVGTRELGHFDLVLSQLPTDVLQEFHMSVTQEMNLRA